ncbi:hypothetical protein [Vibrio fluvialis]|uniref:hypothetical protein n=1 Tax=Vibrio fluvialis TaxID=676 RepID=UPI003D7E57D2
MKHRLQKNQKRYYNFQLKINKNIMNNITPLLAILITSFTISGCNDDNETYPVVTVEAPEDPIVGSWLIQEPSALLSVVVSKNRTARITVHIEEKDYIGIIPEIVQKSGQNVDKNITLRHYQSLPFGDHILDKISGNFTMDVTQTTPYVSATLNFDLKSESSSTHLKLYRENVPSSTGFGPSEERVSFSDLDYNFPMSIDPEKVSFKHIGDGEIEIHDTRFGNCRIHSKLIPTNANIFQGTAGMDWTHEFKIDDSNTNCKVENGSVGILDIGKSVDYITMSIMAPLDKQLITLHGQIKLN